MLTNEARVELLCGLLVANERALEEAGELNPEQWTQLLTLANRLWLGCTLAHQIFATSLWQRLDSELQEYLDSLKTFSLQRNTKLAQLTASVQQLFAQNDIDAVWIKGGSALYNGIDQPVGKRWMMDLDVLVENKQIDETLKLLVECGFKPKSDLEDVRWRREHHAPGLVSPDGSTVLEVHFHSLHRLKTGTSNHLSTADIFANKVPFNMAGMQAWQADGNDQVVQALIHDQLGHRHYANNVIHLRYLLHFCWLVEHYNGHLDWSRIFQLIDDPKLLEIVLYLCWKLFELETPLTEKFSVAGESYWGVSLDNHLNPRWVFHSDSIRSRFLACFSRERIYDLYGSDHGLALFFARLRNVKRLIKIRLNPAFLQQQDQALNKKHAGMAWYIE